MLLCKSFCVELISTTRLVWFFVSLTKNKILKIIYAYLEVKRNEKIFVEL